MSGNQPAFDGYQVSVRNLRTDSTVTASSEGFATPNDSNHNRKKEMTHENIVEDKPIFSLSNSAVVL